MSDLGASILALIVIALPFVLATSGLVLISKNGVVYKAASITFFLITLALVIYFFIFHAFVW